MRKRNNHSNMITPKSRSGTGACDVSFEAHLRSTSTATSLAVSSCEGPSQLSSSLSSRPMASLHPFGSICTTSPAERAEGTKMPLQCRYHVSTHALSAVDSWAPQRQLTLPSTLSALDIKYERKRAEDENYRRKTQIDDRNRHEVSPCPKFC